MQAIERRKMRILLSVNDTVVGAFTEDTPSTSTMTGNNLDLQPTRFFKSHANSYYTFYSALIIIFIITGCLIFVVSMAM